MKTWILCLMLMAFLCAFVEVLEAAYPNGVFVSVVGYWFWGGFFWGLKRLADGY